MSLGLIWKEMKVDTDNGLNLINSIYNIKTIIISFVLYEKRFNNIINLNSIIRWNKRKVFKQKKQEKEMEKEIQ